MTNRNSVTASIYAFLLYLLRDKTLHNSQFLVKLRWCKLKGKIIGRIDMSVVHGQVVVVAKTKRQREFWPSSFRLTATVSYIVESRSFFSLAGNVSFPVP